MRKISLLAAIMILSVGLSAGITINIDIFNFGGDKNSQNASNPENSTQKDPTPARDTTVEQQDKVNPGEQRKMERNPITQEKNPGLGSKIKSFILSLL
ncbi:hypothetical protein GKQ38_01470 [Candidatus Nanohaloarchaea archaeon]|nr:hypothetical protein GKQ38_01470 [Candidatus Nanohaloarchaea archaeon]